MIKSMTGFGKSEGIVGTKKISIEIRSLNSKFFDCNMRMPSIYREKEMEVRSLLAKEVSRGKCDFSISYEALEGEQNFQVNRALLKTYHSELGGVIEDLKLEGVDSSELLSTLMRMPDVMRSEKAKLTDEEWKGISSLIKEALKNFQKFRIEEGKSLENELGNRIQEIKDLHALVPQFEDERVEIVRERINKNIEEVIEKDNIDQNRLEQEMIYYIEKYDVTEEKVRLSAHCEHFIDTMTKESTQGKKLGFITQEIGREINTLGSKANHAEMQKVVVQMKDALEKIKEQSLNVL